MAVVPIQPACCISATLSPTITSSTTHSSNPVPMSIRLYGRRRWVRKVT